MNLLRIYGATLLVALTMGMSACKNEDAPVTAPATNAEANSGQKISLNVDIEGLPSSDLRAMELQENIVGNKHAGLKFVWKTGDTEKFFIAFKKESGSSFTASGPMVVRESTLTILVRRATATRLVSMSMHLRALIPTLKRSSWLVPSVSRILMLRRVVH